MAQGGQVQCKQTNDTAQEPGPGRRVLEIRQTSTSTPNSNAETEMLIDV